MVYLSHSLKETKILGKMLGRSLPMGSVLIAKGDLGAGKTAFAKGVAEGMGVKDIVNSPTFNIIKVYHGKRGEFYHIDAYRLEEEDSVKEIGLDEILGDESGICFVEWGDFIKEYLEKVKRHVYVINIKYLSLNHREISVEVKYE